MKMILMLALVISFMDYQSIMVLTEGGPMNQTNVMFLYIYQLFFPITAGSSVVPGVWLWRSLQFGGSVDHRWCHWPVSDSRQAAGRSDR